MKGSLIRRSGAKGLDLLRFGVLFEFGRQIDGISDDGEFHAGGIADGTENNLPGGHSGADLKHRSLGGLKLSRPGTGRRVDRACQGAEV